MARRLRPPCPSKAAKARLRGPGARAVSSRPAPVDACGGRAGRSCWGTRVHSRIMPDHAQASTGTQDYVGDPRNDSILVSVNGTLAPREDAKVSAFDSGFVLGDGVW